MNLTAYRTRSGYGHRVRWSKNAVAAKARLRIERAQSDPKSEACKLTKLPRLKFGTITIQFGQRERSSFRVHRYDAKRFLALGRIQAASSIGKRIALVLEAML